VSILIFCITLGYGVSAVFNGKTQKQLPIYSVQREDKKIAISFDCAWGVDYTDKLLEIMQIENVKCTFFMVEFWTEKHPDYVKKIFDAGHEIGTHSATHPYMSKLDKTAIIRELTSSSQAIENITGKKVDVFRPPYGDYDDLLIDTAFELGLYTIQWDVDSLDWKDLSANEITKRVTSKVKNGSIVLFHNQGLHTAESLLEIIKTLKNKGYEFVPIGDLIYRDGYKMGADGSQIKLNNL
jgi:polysaccharide deacetylase family sporulation protein PdaB